MTAAETCGAWPDLGGCILQPGHNIGQADVPDNHAFADRLSNSEIVDLTRTLKHLNDALDEYGFGKEISFRELARLARLGADLERGQA